jgi:hypothetical protein
MDKVVTPTQTISLSTVARRRMRTSREEIAVLDEYYRKNPNPNQEEKKEIANLLKMGTKNVHFWYAKGFVFTTYKHTNHHSLGSKIEEQKKIRKKRCFSNN